MRAVVLVMCECVHADMRSHASVPLDGLLGATQDIEKLASKKGVVLQSVKEVLQVGFGAWRLMLLQRSRPLINSC